MEFAWLETSLMAFIRNILNRNLGLALIVLHGFFYLLPWIHAYNLWQANIAGFACNLPVTELGVVPT